MSAAADPDDSSNGSSGLRDRLRQLYHGRTPAALRFQFATLIVDILIIGFFVATPMLRDRPEFLWLDYTVAIIVASPMLFEPECRTPRQMVLANALCRFREMAGRT